MDGGWVAGRSVFSLPCDCIVCNPLVKAREKIEKVCPATGLGFIGPMPTWEQEYERERAYWEWMSRVIRGDPTTMSGWPKEWERKQ